MGLTYKPLFFILLFTLPLFSELTEKDFWSPFQLILNEHLNVYHFQSTAGRFQTTAFNARAAHYNPHVSNWSMEMRTRIAKALPPENPKTLLAFLLNTYHFFLLSQWIAHPEYKGSLEFRFEEKTISLASAEPRFNLEDLKKKISALSPDPNLYFIISQGDLSGPPILQVALVSQDIPALIRFARVNLLKNPLWLQIDGSEALLSQVLVWHYDQFFPGTYLTLETFLEVFSPIKKTSDFQIKLTLPYHSDLATPANVLATFESLQAKIPSLHLTRIPAP
jgi:hypothetical protein